MKTIISWSLGICLIVLLVWFVSPANLLYEIEKVSFFSFFTAIIIYLVNAFLRVFRFRILTGTQLPYSHILNIQFVGILLNKVLPGRVGALYKIYYQNKVGKQDMGSSFGSVLLENAFEIIVIFSTSGVLLLYLEYDIFQSTTVSTILLFLIVLFIVSILYFCRCSNFMNLSIGFFTKVMTKLRLKEKYKISVATFNNDLHNYMISMGFAKMILVFFFTWFIWITVSVSNYFIFVSMDLHLSFENIYLVSTIPLVIGIFGIVPGGLGLKESVLVIFLTAVGISIEASAAFAILTRFVDYFIYGLLALSVYACRDRRIPGRVEPENG